MTRNSSRRLRLAWLSRSAAWSDFFSTASPAPVPGTRPVPGSVVRKPPDAVCWITQPASGPVAPAPSQRLAAVSGLRHAVCDQGGEAPARLARCDCVGQRSSWPNPGLRQNALPTLPAFRLRRRMPTEISCAGHPHTLSPYRFRRGKSPNTVYTITGHALEHLHLLLLPRGSNLPVQHLIDSFDIDEPVAAVKCGQHFGCRMLAAQLGDFVCACAVGGQIHAA